jgi:hypothetical protein
MRAHRSPSHLSSVIWAFLRLLVIAWVVSHPLGALAQAAPPLSETQALAKHANCEDLGGATEHLLLEANETCLRARQELLASQRRHLRIAGLPRSYRPLLIAGFTSVAVGAVALGVSFILLLNSTNFHSDPNEDLQLASGITAASGLGVALTGLGLILIAKCPCSNANQARVRALGDEIEAIQRRRKELKLRRREASLYFGAFGFRVAF